jgi:hypothetical protein
MVDISGSQFAELTARSLGSHAGQNLFRIVFYHRQVSNRNRVFNAMEADRLRFKPATKHQVPCCGQQQVFERQRLRQVSSPVSALVQTRASPHECSDHPPIGGFGCQRLPSPLISVLLASVAERGDGDNAQSILEDHLLRVWDETVTSCFSPNDVTADNKDNRNNDFAAWTTHDAGLFAILTNLLVWATT